ncbi:hypothetical protein ACPCHT_22060 [Nucisporomicrobium flavum]|uniref:hypothetical protein n=1 Tax=Nucisporomicrobium flavum TaxID=2785915 RepID=UPI0018F79406|nr:hypothetical protein [Nucisporomicrobium flavum]
MQPVELVCDESGYEGEKLIGTTTDVFAHAGVHLSAAVAAGCLAELRRRIRSPATQYKANHLQREKHRSALVWFLGPSSPLFRAAHVYLIDKAYFLIGTLAEVLLGPPGGTGTGWWQSGPDGGRAREVSDELYRRHAADGPEPAFLVAANNLMRGKDRRDLAGPVDAFFDVAGGSDGFRRDSAEALRVRLQADPSLSVLDPLIPALLRAVARWGDGGRPVTIVHDRQTMLPAERVARLQRALRHAGLVLTRVELAAAESEPRVQLADILAGTVRQIAQDELHGRGDAELLALARPYVDPLSIWGDRRSWATITGTARS